MAVTDLTTEIESVIRQVINNNSLEIGPDSRLMDDIGLESIDLLDVSSELENTIGLEVDFKDVVMFLRERQKSDQIDMKSVRVRDLIEYIEEKRQS
jgi:acyl carrier protein